MAMPPRSTLVDGRAGGDFQQLGLLLRAQRPGEGQPPLDVLPTGSDRATSALPP